LVRGRGITKGGGVSKYFNDAEMGVTFKPTANGGVGVIQNDAALKALSSSTLSAKEFREKIDLYLRGVVEERLKMVGAEALVEKELARRVEIAVKYHAGRIDAEVKRLADDLIRRRLTELVSKMPLTVIVEAATTKE
jgi:hypothetical protein